jgi:hypothetical protein
MITIIGRAMKDTYKSRPANAKLIALSRREIIEEQP